MARKWGNLAVVFGGLVALAFAVGCQSTEDDMSGTRSVAQTPVEPPAPTPAPAPAPVARPGMVTASTAFPTGVRETSVLLLERSAPAEVAVGQVFDYDIKATDISQLALSNVLVTDRCASNFKLESSTPAAKTEDGQLVWGLGNLGPGESKTIKVRGSATGLGQMTNCMAAAYDQSACLAINVVQPKIKLDITAPAEVLRCDPITIKYVVTNTGTGAARNVVLTQQFPAGVTTTDGSRAIQAKVDVLEGGQSRAFNATVNASGAGKIDHTATVTADGNLTGEAKTSTIVRVPQLTIKKTGTEKVFVGRPVSYDIVVTNTGDGDARNAVVEDQIPAGCKVVSATDGATAQADRLVWQAGTLKPKDSATYKIVVMPAAIGKIVNNTSARAFCAEPVMASAPTSVEGIAAILLEMVDDPDPVELGKTVTYTVTLTNQGSAMDTGLKVVCTLEDSMEYVSSSGATTGSNDGKTVTFAPLGSLAPKDKAQWKVVVKAIQEGDVRFKVSITSDELTRPVEKTESTHFYK